MYTGDVAGGDGDAGDFLHNGMKFTTYDRDNDLWNSGNNAAFLSGGWWFDVDYCACLTCSPVYVHWLSLQNFVHPPYPNGLLSAARMVIKANV
jgi:hypothetical protein